MPPTFVTIKGRRVNVKDVTTKDRPFFGSKKFHLDSNSLLMNAVANHRRDITALKKMPKSKTTDADIKRLKTLVTQKTNEVNHRRMMAEKHNLRFG